ncbi:MAG: hypothetical protein ACP5LW_05540 [Nitrososphaeria archaeon]
MIAVVIAGFALLVYPLLLRYQSASQAQLRASQEMALQAETLISPVYSYATQRGGQTLILVYLYNYGKVPFAPQEFIVAFPGGGVYQSSGFTIVNAADGQELSEIPPGAVAEVEISIPYSGPIPSAYNVTAVGNGMSFTWSL